MTDKRSGLESSRRQDTHSVRFPPACLGVAVALYARFMSRLQWTFSAGRGARSGWAYAGDVEEVFFGCVCSAVQVGSRWFWEYV